MTHSRRCEKDASKKNIFKSFATSIPFKVPVRSLNTNLGQPVRRASASQYSPPSIRACFIPLCEGQLRLRISETAGGGLRARALLGRIQALVRLRSRGEDLQEGVSRQRWVQNCHLTHPSLIRCLLSIPPTFVIISTSRNILLQVSVWRRRTE